MLGPPYTREDIQYRFHRLYAIDLDSVAHSLRLLRRYRRADIRFCIFRELVVAYSRPFSGNRSPGGGKHHLSLSFVPKEHRSLHDELVELRMQLIARTDFSVHEPRVSMWKTARGPVFPMKFRRPNYEGLLSRVPEIASLVTAVEAALQVAIREHEAGA